MMLPLQGAHSAVAPAGPQARSIDGLWNAMYYTALAVFVVVAGGLLLAAFRRTSSRGNHGADNSGAMRRAVVAATGITIVTLFVFLVLDVSTGRVLAKESGRPIAIRVTAHQWWWEVEYPDSIPQRQITTANEIHIPVGLPVVVELRSDDVIHSFWPPNLSGKRDLIPGKINTLSFRADRAGVYRGQCAEYCGAQHAKMAFLIVADPPDSFTSWQVAQRDTAGTPAQQHRHPRSGGVSVSHLCDVPRHIGHAGREPCGTRPDPRCFATNPRCGRAGECTG